MNKAEIMALDKLTESSKEVSKQAKRIKEVLENEKLTPEDAQKILMYLIDLSKKEVELSVKK